LRFRLDGGRTLRGLVGCSLQIDYGLLGIWTAPVVMREFRQMLLELPSIKLLDRQRRRAGSPLSRRFLKFQKGPVLFELFGPAKNALRVV